MEGTIGVARTLRINILKVRISGIQVFNDLKT